MGNWSFSPVYTYESPQWATIQSATDSNLNGDSAGDRVILNPGGVQGTGSDVTPLLNSGGETVGYTPIIPMLDTSLPAPVRSPRSDATRWRPANQRLFTCTYKDIGITERLRFRFGAQFANLLNHRQYIPGSNPGQGWG